MRISPKTIHHPNFQPSESCKRWCRKVLSSFFSVLQAYAPGYKDIPLDLGFSWEPVFTSGPNTYKDPQKESLLGK